MRHRTPHKANQSAKLERDLEKFLAKGNTITEVPFGVLTDRYGIPKKRGRRPKATSGGVPMTIHPNHAWRTAQ